MPKRKPIHTLLVGDTKILTHGMRHGRLRDPYHLVLTLTWPGFFLALVLVFILLNLMFATIYWLMPGSVANVHDGVFLDYFFFSAETLATVGYGVMSPATLAGHVLATIESLTGMVGVAVITGLVFARFSKPTARILFSHHVLIRDLEGKRALMLRMANERHNRIVEATATLSLLRLEVNADGEHFVRIHDLHLVRKRTPVFALTWTLIHIIDEKSPFFGRSASEIVARHPRITVSVSGHDETMAATVYASHNYEAKDIVFDAHFVDIISETPEGGRIVNMTRFHDIKPVSTTHTEPQHDL